MRYLACFGLLCMLESANLQCPQNGLEERCRKWRKQIKERKNRTKKLRGAKKSAAARRWQGVDILSGSSCNDPSGSPVVPLISIIIALPLSAMGGLR